MGPMNLVSDTTSMLKGKLTDLLGSENTATLEKGAGMASDFLTGKTEANSLFSFLGQGAGRALSYAVMLKGANSAISTLGNTMGMDLDFNSAIPYVTAALTAYTAYNQYKSNEASIKGDATNKWDSVATKAKVLISDEGSMSQKLEKVMGSEPKVVTPVMDIPRVPKIGR